MSSWKCSFIVVEIVGLWHIFFVSWSLKEGWTASLSTSILRFFWRVWKTWRMSASRLSIWNGQRRWRRRTASLRRRYRKLRKKPKRKFGIKKSQAIHDGKLGFPFMQSQRGIFTYEAIENRAGIHLWKAVDHIPLRIYVMVKSELLFTLSWKGQINGLSYFCFFPSVRQFSF